jgi:AAHS family 4-hydroxybenzoate transporter-like MFS transporter
VTPRDPNALVVPPAPIVAGAIIGMQLGMRVSFLFYVIPAVVGALAAFLFVRKETRGKSLDQLAQETSLSS